MNIIRASELGSCLKAQVAKQLGFSPMDTPEVIQAAFERGNEHEELCAGAMTASGWVIANQQLEVTLDVLDGWQVVGHLDGTTMHAEGDLIPRVWEAKAPNAYDKFEHAYKNGDWSDPLAHRYAWQISTYMLSTGLEAYVTSWDEERGVRGFGIEIPPFTLDDIENRVRIIALSMNHGELPQMCSQNDWPCPFFYLHENTEEITEDPVLDRMVEDYAGIVSNEKYIAMHKKEAQEKIKTHLGGKDILTATSKVTFYTQAGPTKYDTERMKADGIDLERYTIPGKPSARMKITRRGSDEST